MADNPANPWIHIGECPVCVNGLCRVRTCSANGQRHFFAMCDECEALWLTPSTQSPRTFADSSEPKCPICQQDLYGEQSHWSVIEELKSTDWMENAIFEFPVDIESPNHELHSESIAWDDVGQTTDLNSADLNAELRDLSGDDPRMNHDEPKPEC